MRRCLELQAEAPSRTRAQRFFGKDPLVASARSWYKGAIGERDVAKILDSLGPDFVVLHAVPIGAGESDIDHVVIGPTGVFTINTKNHAGKSIFVSGRAFMVNGQHTDHMRNASFEADRAARLLAGAAGVWTPVQPLIVVAGGARLKMGKKRPSVVVLRSEQLRGWLFALPRRLSQQEVEYLAMVAEERRTWHAQAIVVTDTLRHEQRFDRLVRDIRDAAFRRRVWRVGIVGSLLAIPAGALVGFDLAQFVLATHGA
jgi:hypothetical protein